MALYYGIYSETKKIKRAVKEMGKRIEADPSLATQNVDEENMKLFVNTMQKLIKYKTELGIDCSQEVSYLKQAEVKQ